MLTHKDFKAKLLQDPEVRAEYERLQPEMELLDVLLSAREQAGLTQAEVATRMGTKAPAVARLESSLATGKHSPSIATVRKYLAACGKRLLVKAEDADEETSNRHMRKAA